MEDDHSNTHEPQNHVHDSIEKAFLKGVYEFRKKGVHQLQEGIEREENGRDKKRNAPEPDGDCDVT
jgi:hypothetical protein